MSTLLILFESSGSAFIFSVLLLLGRIGSPRPYIGSVPAGRGAYVGGFGYQQPVSYNYQQGFMYPPYG